MLLLCALMAGSGSVWAETGTVTITSGDLEGSSGYPTSDQTFTVSNIGFGYNTSVYKPTVNNTPSGWGGGQVIQFKKSDGCLYNTQAIGKITNIRVYRATGTTNFTVYGGDTQNPTSEGIASNAKSGVTSDTETIDYTAYASKSKKTSESTTSITYFDFDFSGSKPNYFTIKNTSSSALYLYKIVITYEKTEITLASACTDGEKYYGTYSSGMAFVVPADLTVSEIKVADGKLALTNYATDDVVPANTGVMISSATDGAHYVMLTSDGTSKLGTNNMLKASGDAGIDDTAMTAASDSDTKFYRLTMHNGTQIGFWWGAAEGAAFALGANKAYLAVPAAAQVSGFSFDEDMTTGISSNLRETAADGRYYTMQGVEVAQPTKGLYIVNGKKVILK